MGAKVAKADEKGSQESVAGPRLLPVGQVTRWSRRRAIGGYGGGDEHRYGTNAPQTAQVVVHVPADVAEGTAWSLTIEDDRGRTVATMPLGRKAGTHVHAWDLRVAGEEPARGRRPPRPRTATNGTYTAVLKVGDAEAQRQPFEVRGDPLTAGVTVPEPGEDG
jgi:hypothetical protein